MVKTRRHYDDEFKCMVVSLIETGKSTAEIGKELGIGQTWQGDGGESITETKKVVFLAMVELLIKKILPQ